MPRFDGYEKSLQERLLALLASPGYQPLKQHELVGALHVKGSDRSEFRNLLRKLEREGRISCLRKNRWGLPDNKREVLGRISVHPSGFGFVTPDEGGGPDIYIGHDDMGTALHGDKVMISVSRSRNQERFPARGRAPGKSEERLSGKVTRVVSRRTTRVAGILRKLRSLWYVIPDDPRIGRDIRVNEFGPLVKTPQDLRKVVVQLDEWEDASTYLSGTVVEDLGDPQAAGVDVLSILRGHGLYEAFDDKVVDEATATPTHVSEKDLKNRVDLRQAVIFTIDPEDAKDFDDAVSMVKRDDGNWDVGVHIADVSHFVPIKSKVDDEAYIRGNSVYMVDRFIPMLPKYLTAEVCSLRSNVDRLAHSVDLVVSPRGNVESFKTYPSVIHSVARLTYDQVQLHFDGQTNHGIPPALLPTLNDMRHLAETLRKNRMKRGAIDLSMPEVKCELDSDGRALGFHKRGAKEAYHLIEEFMLLANVAVAEIMSDKQVPAMYRIHEAPSDEQWEQMAVDLQNLGLRVTPGDRAGINRVAKEIAGTAFEYSGNLAILKNLKRALYSPELVEHFGLAFDRYTHFTSPIRRYPDLVVHRILKAIEQRAHPPYSFEAVERIARHCCDTEKNASEAEDESLAVKRIEFYAARLAAKDVGPFDGLIVSINPKGLIVELSDSLQRGMVAFANLMDDHYIADVQRGRARGRRSQREFRIGQALTVELMKVDTYRKLIDFRPAKEELSKPVSSPKSKRQRTR